MSNTVGPNYANGALTDDIVATPATAQTAFTGLTTGSSGMTLVAAGTTAGKRINRAWWLQTATSAAGVINWWYNPSSTTAILLASMTVPAVTPSTTVAPTKTFCPDLTGFVIPTGANIYVTNTIAQAGMAGVEGASF